MNPFENITAGGVVMLVVLIVIAVVVFIVINYLRGNKLSLPAMVSKARRIKASDNALCFNVYEDSIKVESMLASSVSAEARTWKFNGKVMFFQGCKVAKYAPIFLIDTVSYPAERLARMMGCEPLQKLKALKFGLLEQLAPFAPVIALAIGAILFIIIIG